MSDLSHTHLRILAAMRAHGAVTERDFDRSPTIDGGDEYNRLAPRIMELRAMGYAIETQLRKSARGKRYAAYVLGETSGTEMSSAPSAMAMEGAVSHAAAPSGEALETPGLFEAPAPARPHWDTAA